MTRRKRPDLTLGKVRSAITNGSHLLWDVDARSAWMRRYRDLILAHESDLGGADYVSEAERRLIKRAAMIELQCELLDAKFANNGGEASAFDLERYQRSSNTLRRLLETLSKGLERRAKDMTPTLDQYLAQLNKRDGPSVAPAESDEP
jgi:hypothetical protein